MWTVEYEHPQGEGAPRSARLSCLLVGSGAGGVAVRNAITAMLGGIGAANRRLADMQLAARVWIDEVEFLELWLDKAGQAAEALELALKDGELADLFVLDGTATDGTPRAIVAPGQGGLRRIDMEEAPNWWNRLEIAYEPERDVLRFVAMTDRARAEVMLVAGQLKTAEKFIERAIRSASRDEEISRTLFEMLVPNRLKELAPDQQDVWLLLDERSGGFPWELLEDRWSRDGRPLAVASGMLRQFKTIEFRERPAPAIGDAALVIGNPQLPPLRPDFPFLDLPGAQKEADDVAALLDDHHFSVTRLTKSTPERIFGSLHARDYRILHLAGHGVHEWEVIEKWPPRDYPQGRPEEQKRLISGMVLGDGVFLTPGDVEQMRFVPELVFINCCHLGQLGTTEGRNPWWLGNKLAANLAAQFIRMGVRAVIAAGWAVDDAAALAFATSFYDRMLSGEPFGRAVQRAREVTFLQHGGTNTWGAFQCYGDPDWRLRPRRALRVDAALTPLRSPAHAAVELENLSQRLRMGSGSATRLLDRRLQQLRDEHPDWLSKAEVAAAAGIALGEVERFDEAVDLLTTAIGAQKAEVSLRAVEQRANFVVKAALRQALSGQRLAAGEENGPVARMRAAIDDLASLRRLGETRERLNLLGSAYKRLSWIAGDAGTRDDALVETARCYAAAHERVNAKAIVDAYPLTNWLMAAAVASWFRPQDGALRVPDAPRLATEGIRWSEAKEAKEPDFWSTVATADCRLAARLQSGTLGKAAVDEITADYRRAIGRGASPKEVGSVREQIDYLLAMAKQAKKTALAADLARRNGAGGPRAAGARGLPRPEHQKVLVRQEPVLRAACVAGARHFVFHLLRRDARALRRPDRRVHREIDDRHLAPRLQAGAQPLEVGHAVVDVVVGVDDQHLVHLGRQLRIVGLAVHRFKVGEPALRRALAQVAHHVGLDVDRVHAPPGCHVRQPHREVPRSGADVGHRGVGRQRERADHLVRLLPGVARGIVEHLRPVLGALEIMVVRVRRLRLRRPQQRARPERGQ